MLPVLWTGGQWYDEEDWRNTPSLWPVKIQAGALGKNQPANDLYVSQQHRMHVSGEQLELWLGHTEAIVAAKHLCWLPGVSIEAPKGKIGYFHILCDGHQLVNAQGTWAETIHLGDEALLSMFPTNLAELARRITDWPEGVSQSRWMLPTCLPVLNSREARLLFGNAHENISVEQTSQSTLQKKI